MTAARTKNGTISGVTTVTLDAQYAKVEVLNRDATIEIFFTTDGTAPTVDGDNCYCVQAGHIIQVNVPTQGTTVVKMIPSTGTPKYSVTGMAANEIVRQ